MPSHHENKNKAVEKSLALLLRRLKEAKRKEAGWGPYAYQGDMEALNDGIRALENTQFASVDDFGSVKELVEVEQLFSQTYRLNNFCFPDYKSYIHPALLAYVEIEVQLDNLEMKAYDLAYRGHRLAASEAANVVFQLRGLNGWYFGKRKIEYNDYQANALRIINESRSVLEQHRGYKQILGNVIVLILTLGTGFIIHKAISGHFLFFNQTDSAKQIDALSQTVIAYQPLPQQPSC